MADSDSDPPSNPPMPQPDADPNPPQSSSEPSAEVSSSNPPMPQPDADPNPPASSSEPSAEFSSSDPDPVSSSDPDTVLSSFKSGDGEPVASPLSSPSSAVSHWIPSDKHAAFYDTLPLDIISTHSVHLWNIFHAFETRAIKIAEFELAVLKLIKDVPASLEAFNKLLPIGKLVRSPSSRKGTTVFTKKPYINDKVRAELYNDTANYMLWLAHLIEYEKGAESLADFRRNVEVHFVNKPNLWREFNAEYPPDGDNATPSSTSGAEVSDSKEPGLDSKRRKTL